jgi:hypothetical protein
VGEANATIGCGAVSEASEKANATIRRSMVSVLASEANGQERVTE